MKHFTPPVLKKGKVSSDKKGSARKSELAKNMWYVEYYFLDPSTEKMKQFRVKDGVNRIDDPDEKEIQGEAMRLAIHNKLEAGWSPIDGGNYYKEVEFQQLNLKEGINVFIDYHHEIGSKKKTIGSYSSKLKFLLEYLGERKVNSITTYDLEQYVLYFIKNRNHWSNVTVKAAKGVLTAFFHFMVKRKIVKLSPMIEFDYRIKSIKDTPEKHVPFSDEDLHSVLKWLYEHDRYSYFFCNMIYYTCIRPGEIIGLRLTDIDLLNNRLTIPTSVKKVTSNPRPDVISIDIDFLADLEKLELFKYPSSYYLVGDVNDIVGQSPIEGNKPYKRFIKCLKALSLTGKGYDLYSFKHTSNVKKWESGEWTISEIQKANRHSSISMTEKYLKGLTKRTDITGKKVPSIKVHF